MPKYTPLYDYLRRKSQTEIEMNFTQIERVIGSMLPKSASRPQWWANERSTQTRHVQCSAGLDAGFHASLLSNERVLFRRRTRGTS
jgi:hypothetical protein